MYGQLFPTPDSKTLIFFVWYGVLGDNVTSCRYLLNSQFLMQLGAILKMVGDWKKYVFVDVIFSLKALTS